MTAQLKEAIKTFAKVCIAAAAPVLIVGLQNHQGWQDMGVAIVIALLMAINDYVRMHPGTDAVGILPSAPTPP